MNKFVLQAQLFIIHPWPVPIQIVRPSHHGTQFNRPIDRSYLILGYLNIIKENIKSRL